MNAFLSKRIAVLERELLESREPTVVVIRGALPADQQPAIAQTVEQPNDSDSDDPSGCPLTDSDSASPTPPTSSRAPPLRTRRGLAFVQAPAESAERFYDRVLSEAGEAPFIVFGGLADQGEQPPIYRSEL
jgi:hypothetical protein